MISENTVGTAAERPKFTGKQLVMINSEATPRRIKSQVKNASLNLAYSGDFENTPQEFPKALAESDGVVFEKFGVAVINQEREAQVAALTESVSGRNTFTYSEPERYIYALDSGHNMNEYLRGYKAAVDHLTEELTGGELKSMRESCKPKKTAPDFKDDAQSTWGISAINFTASPYAGNGVNIAILDTGFNINHPDFKGRNVITHSFVNNQSAEDGNGHGSHCIGIAAGGISHATGVRYGVASGANIYAGKVLNNSGSGTDSSILAGMEWAVTNGCKVISMSLGAPVAPGERYSNIYNDLAKKALDFGTIIIAAAGNESERNSGIIKPVGHPANCPAIMAVAALDNKLNVAYFSCGGINNDGGQVDIAAPGVDIYSSWKKPSNFNTISGTSMATPYVAGIAALFWEAYPSATASQIWMYIVQHAKRLNLLSSDVGVGIAQCPL